METKKNYLLSYQKSIALKDGILEVDGKRSDLKDGVSAEDAAQNLTREYYIKFLSNHFDNLSILTGAGSSVSIGNSDSKTGLTMKELWNVVKKGLIDQNLSLEDTCKKIKFPYSEKETGDLESLLSKMERAAEFVGDLDEKIILNIKKLIKDACTLKIPNNSPHEILLKKIVRARKQASSRIKLFTLNYDTLFEQAAEKSGFTIIDGFSFSYPRRFDGKYFDYDIVRRENNRINNENCYLERVVHFYKIHGSLDWERITKEDGSYIVKKDNTNNPLLIYPKQSKYENSYEQPFFEMISRFQNILRQPNMTLICIGFSFSDKHISTIIKEALYSNPSFQLVIVTPDLDSEHLQELQEYSKKANNLHLISETFSEFSHYLPYPRAYDENALD